MPRAFKVEETRSEYFPRKLSILMADNQPKPELSANDHQKLIKEGYSSWRLKRARIRKNKAENLEKKLRQRILDTINEMPGKIYGFKVFGKRGVETRVIDQHFDTILDNDAFITHLGLYASQVITGAQLPLEEIVKGPDDFARLIKAVAAEFGDDIAQRVTLVYDRDRLNELINAERVLPDLPEGVMGTKTGSQQVRVEFLDASGSVVRTPRKPKAQPKKEEDDQR